MQEIGLARYDDLLVEIPREEIGRIGEAVKKAANDIYPGTVCSIMGSYRRGAMSGHDVDCLLTNAKYPNELPKGALAKIIKSLERSEDGSRGILTDHLCMPVEHRPKGLFFKVRDMCCQELAHDTSRSGQSIKIE